MWIGIIAIVVVVIFVAMLTRSLNSAAGGMNKLSGWLNNRRPDGGKPIAQQLVAGLILAAIVVAVMAWVLPR